MARAGISISSWGEAIEFQLKEIDADQTEIQFSSRPVLRTTLIDYGKNLRNIELLEEFLNKNL